MFEYRLIETTWGSFGFVARDGKLVWTTLPRPSGKVRAEIRRRYLGAVENARLLPRFAEQVASYFSGDPSSFDVELDLSEMTPFRRKVAEKCRALEPGETVSYADLARAAGRPLAARAVGQVMATNPLPLVVPCHRVLASGGRIGGFSSAGGLSDKQRLLELEGALIRPQKTASPSTRGRRTAGRRLRADAAA